MNRIDKILVDQGLVESRTQAQKLIAAGAVTVQDRGVDSLVTKPSAKYSDDIEVKVEAIKELKYVSRAGLKLESAFEQMQSLGIISCSDEQQVAKGKIVLDVGQSTGGFTDFLLKTGAEKVVGIDVGHNQLVKSLQTHERVVFFEGINARELPAERVLEQAPQGFDWIVMDVSFISQTLIIPNLARCLKPGGMLISLVKPQFEAGKDAVGKGGIVKGKESFKRVQHRICDSLVDNGFEVKAYFDSGFPGADGNLEFFAVAQKV